MPYKAVVLRHSGTGSPKKKRRKKKRNQKRNFCRASSMYVCTQTKPAQCKVQCPKVYIHRIADEQCADMYVCE